MFCRYLITGVLLASFLPLSGCAVLVIGGAAATASIAYDRRTTGSIMEDTAIEVRVRSRLGDDQEITEQTHINITSFNGIVLLSGEAPTEALRSRAGEITRKTEKVRRVNNELTLAAPSAMMSRSSDSLITAKVKAALSEIDIKDFSLSRVKVVTENGTVFLMGLVYHREADAATEKTRQVGGVQRVVKLFEYMD